MHDWKSYTQRLPKLKRKVVPPLYQINMESISSSVKFVEGYLHEVVLVDNSTGYHWLYGMKTKDEMWGCETML
jgi:hypothetical protein